MKDWSDGRPQEVRSKVQSGICLFFSIFRISINLFPNYHLKSTSNNALNQLSPTGDHKTLQGFGPNDGRNQTDPFPTDPKKDEFINSYMKEKSSRDSKAELLAITNPEVEADILNSIEQKYFQLISDPQKAEQLVLEDLPQELDLNYLTEQKSVLKRQLIVVSKKVSDLILKNEFKYRTELERVTKLQTDLSEAIKVCTSGRNHLSCAKRDFTGVSLGIVASYRRREVLKSLLKSLQTIKTLQETDIRLRELLDEDEDYTGAIQLYLECNKVVSALKHYSCISELNTKLQDTLEMTEEQIDVALSKMCLTFNKDLYLKLMCAYNLLGKTQTAMDQLLMHFASAIHNKAFSIVLGYVELFASTPDSSSNFHKRQYNELCKCLTSESFVVCLTDLCKALWDIMANYFRILSFHKEEAIDYTVSETTTESDPNSDVNNEIDSTFNKTFVIQKLEHGLVRIWQDVQQKVRTLVQNHDFSVYNFDDFIKILGIAEKMIEIGDEFCDNKSEDLQDLLHKQTCNYFQSYHKSCMYELKEFLDTEVWTICPVHDFSLTHLQEFQFLRTSLPTRRVLSPNSSPNKKEIKQEYYFSDSFLRPNDNIPANQKTPFDVEEEAIDDKQSEANNNHVNEVKVSNGESDNSELIMTNTTLNVLRLFGKYMQIMSILRPIAYDVLLCMFQLFDYYLFTIYKFFAKDMLIMSENSLSDDMKSTLRRISDNLIADGKPNNDFALEVSTTKNKYLSPTLSSMVDMSSSETLFGLAERVVAVESL